MKIDLPPNKKCYFASDFHLAPQSDDTARRRERRVTRWLEMVRHDAHGIFLVGDIFDFWFEYKKAVPKGFVRFLGKLAELSDAGIHIYAFTGNHDKWLFDYFPKELGIPVYHKPQVFTISGRSFFIGHGDGLGPGDHRYKVLKALFENRAAQYMFRWLHPDLGIALAHLWSNHSRLHRPGHEEIFLGKDEWLWQYSKEQEQRQHHDYYVFGHRHLTLDLPVGSTSRFINLGEWIKNNSFASFDGNAMALSCFIG